MPLWNSRFRKPLAGIALKFSSSIDVDKKLYNEDLDGSRAHVRMLVKQNIIRAADGKAMLKALEEIRREIKSGTLDLNWRKEDIHTAIEERLVRKIGDRGKWLHTARSRNDQVALDERLYLRKQIKAMLVEVRRFQRALLKQAEKHRTTIIPGYTHLQRAQPILFAHHLLAYIEMLQRDSQRFADCLKRVNLSPLGAGALAGTTLPIDRRYTARLLKFTGVLENSIDAVSDRDVQIEFLGACAITMMHLSRFAGEVVLWCSAEFGFAGIDDSFSTGSSLMPQKKNPDMAELIRGRTGRVYGDLVNLLVVMKGLPLAYNRDMQEDKEPLFDAAETTIASLEVAAQMLAATTFNAARFEPELKGDLSLATDIVDYLVRKGIPFRRAHEVVGKIVAVCVSKEKKLDELSLKTLRKIDPLITPDVFVLFNPRRSVASKRSAGGTSLRSVGRRLSAWRRYLL